MRTRHVDMLDVLLSQQPSWSYVVIPVFRLKFQFIRVPLPRMLRATCRGHCEG